MRTRYQDSYLHFFLSVCLCLFLSLRSSIAIDATSTYYQNNDLWVTGTLIYTGSSRGTPIYNLDDGQVRRMYFNAEAENSLVRDPYLSNLSADTVLGWIDDGYKIQIEYGGTLAVYQPHNYTSGSQQYETEAWAYYDVSIQSMATELLWRSERSNEWIGIVTGGVILIVIWTIMRVIRND